MESFLHASSRRGWDLAPTGYDRAFAGPRFGGQSLFFRTGFSPIQLYITPRFERFGIPEFQSYEQIIEIGYRSGMEAIEAWSRGMSPSCLTANRRELVSSMLGQTLADLEGVLNQMAEAVN